MAVANVIIRWSLTKSMFKHLSERRKLVRKIRSLVGAERWGEEYDRYVEEKMALLGKRVEGVERDVMDVVHGWLLKELLVWFTPTQMICTR